MATQTMKQLRQTASSKYTPSSIANPDTLKFRKHIRALIAETEKRFAAHCKEWNCKTDSSGCIERAEYQTRLSTLREILADIGGKEVRK